MVKTTYICDRCRRELSYSERSIIVIMWPDANNRSLDFCKRCREAFDEFLLWKL